MMNLSNLVKTKTTESAKRRGRGYGSGVGGHTTGSGQKGQLSRGKKVPSWFEGGQNPLIHRLPHKKGFNSLNRNGDVAIFNLKDLVNIFKEGELVTPQALKEKGMLLSIPKGGVKILGQGKLSKPLNFNRVTFSKTASEKVLSVGGLLEKERKSDAS